MILKLIVSIISRITRIGRSLFIFLIAILATSGCWLFEMDKVGSYKYKSYISNITDDTLMLMITKDIYIYLDTMVVPNDTVFYKGSRVEGEDDVLKDYLFEGTDAYQVQIYKSDTLVKTWDGPAQSMGDAIHHFYNYDSWSVELIDKEYVLVFSILESDLE